MDNITHTQLVLKCKFIYKKKKRIWKVEFLLVEKERHSQHHRTCLSPFFRQQGLEIFVKTRVQPEK